MLVKPVVPADVNRLKFLQLPILVDPRYSCQARVAGQMIPHAFRFVVVEDERVAIGPPAGAQGQCSTIDFATVHGSQIDQRSERHGDVSFPESVVCHFNRAQDGPGRVGPRKSVQVDPQHHRLRGRTGIFPIAGKDHPRLDEGADRERPKTELKPRRNQTVFGSVRHIPLLAGSICDERATGILLGREGPIRVRVAVGRSIGQHPVTAASAADGGDEACGRI